MNNNTKPVWHGIALVAGGAIGAGMFALPVVSAGVWFSWAVLGMLATCLLTVLAALVLLEVNSQFQPGASFHTVVKGVLGPKLAWANNVCIAFIMFILMYAYVTAGASILSFSLESVFNIESPFSRGGLSVIFALTVGVLVWGGTGVVSRVSTMLIVGLVISFVLANMNLADIGTAKALTPEFAQLGYLPYLWAALPVYVTAFACAGLVPSLIKHYPHQPQKSRTSLIVGSVLVLLVYVIWVAATFSVLPREEFANVIQQGGNIGSLVAALQSVGAGSSLKLTLDWFSHFAIITSFLSIGLGLFHFLGDGLRLNATRTGRLAAVVLTFIPPALMSYFYPYGFISAISLAGLLVAFSFFVVPALMSISRFGWRFSSGLVLAFGIIVASLKVALLLGELPGFAM